MLNILYHVYVTAATDYPQLTRALGHVVVTRHVHVILIDKAKAV
jgi:hypothetical protein